MVCAVFAHLQRVTAGLTLNCKMIAKLHYNVCL